MDPAQYLLEINQIMTLKARYCRYLDQKRWDEWRRLFVADLYVDVTGSLPPPNEIFEDAESWCAFIRDRLTPALTIHHVHNPDIVLVDSDNATGSWALFDHIEYPDRVENRGYDGLGLYEDSYRRVDGEWLISSFKIIRLLRTPL
jgi:SnoaL-like protein